MPDSIPPDLQERISAITKATDLQLALLTYHGQAVAYFCLAIDFADKAQQLIQLAAPTYEDSGT